MRVRVGVRGIVLFLVVITIVPFVVAAYFDAEAIRARREETAERETAGIVRQAIAQQGALIDSAHQFLELIANRPEVTSRDGPVCNETLAGLMENRSAYANLAVADMDGHVWCSGIPSNVTTNTSDRTYFHRVLETRRFAVGDYLIGRISGRSALGLGHPVFDPTENLVGVAIATLDAAWLSAHVDSSLLPAGGVITVVDSQGIILARYPDPGRFVGQRMMGNGTIVDEMLRNQRGSITAAGIDGVQRYYSYDSLLPGPDGGTVLVAAGFPKALIEGPAQQELREHVVITLAVAAATFLLVWFGTEAFVARHVGALLDASRKIEHGDMSARSNLHRAPSDLASLGRQFDKMAASVERLDRARRDFINHSAHQLATPLTPLRFQTAVVAQRAEALDDAPLRHSSSILQRNVARLSRTVDGIVRVAETQSSRLDFERVETDVAKIAEAEMTVWQPKFDAKGVLVRRQIEPVTMLLLDAGAVQAAIGHLLENALKFTDPGGTVTISVVRRPGQIEVSVTDTGRGIAPVALARLFQPFVRAHEEAGEADEGLGLGLFFVRTVVERHGGHTFAKSSGPGNGAEFGFTLPA